MCDENCVCCGRHVSELKPYGKAGDPLVGDFEGLRLLRPYRADDLPDEEADMAFEEAYKYCKDDDEDILEWMQNKYGKEKGLQLYGTWLLSHSVSKHSLCRDCIILDLETYYKKFWGRQNKLYRER